MSDPRKEPGRSERSQAATPSAIGENSQHTGTLFIGGGEMGQRMNSFDWSKTPLGASERWPESLKSAVSICLGSGFPIAIYWGRDLTLLYNDMWSPIPGNKHPWALGRTAQEVWPEIWESIAPLFEKVLLTGEATYSEDALLPMHRHGYTEECYFNFTFSPIRGEAGRVEGVFNAVIETTFRVVSERRTRILRELGERLASARTSSDAGHAAVAILGSATADVPFCALYLLHDDARASLVACAGVPCGGPAAPESVRVDVKDTAWPFAEAQTSGRVVVARDLAQQLGVELPGGAWPEPAHSALVAPLLSSGRPTGFLVIGANPRRAIDEEYIQFAERAAVLIANAVSSAKVFEAERRRAEALAEIDRAKTAFFSNVSHEFRTPLALMLGPLEDLRLQAGLDGDARERVELLHRNARRLLKLVNTLLDFARIEAGRVEASFEPTDLATVTRDLASSFRSAVERAGMTLNVECAPLPAPVFIDREMWEKIVLNLLSNAFKFTFEGAIRVRLRADDGAAVLEVSDSGVGIAPHELPHLFERFRRIEGARSRSHEGSGIGLALVQELVHMHGGRIDVSSELGRGTTFAVRIPLGTAHLPSERIREVRAQQNTATRVEAYVEEAMRWLAPSVDPGEGATTTVEARTEKRARIVLADDNADMREYVARLLRERWDVHAVADGNAALEAIRRSPPDLVLTDVMMPGLGGFGLLRAIRDDARLRATPVILLSARAGEEAVVEGIEAGADDYITKPFTARDLLVRVAARLMSAEVRNEERRRLLTLLAEVPAIVNFLRGPDLVFDFVHPMAAKLLGGRELLGKPLVEAVPETREQPYLERIRRVYETGERFSQREAALWHESDGGKIITYWDSEYLPVRDEAGRVEGVMTFDLNVTANVLAREAAERAHQETSRALRELAAASRAKDEFLATMSHELRTPLNAILGWAQLMRRTPHSAERLERAMEVIERNARAQEQIVSDLLDVSRIISGKLNLQLAPTELASVVQAACDVVRPAAASKGVQLGVELANELGTIVADANRMQQVLWNLLSNAVRFTPNGGSVLVKGERLDSRIQLEVRDTGKGIEAEHLPHIFERFRQVDSSTTRAHGGLGLGLAIVRHLVEAHGGTVVAHSDGRDRGTTFTVTLPTAALESALATPPSVERGQQSGVARTLPPTARLDGVRILAVDDDRDSLDLLREVLEAAGAHVSAAVSARAALGLWGPFDVIVSDIGMPDMDGYDLLPALRSMDLHKRLPAIALTAYAGPKDRERALAAGFQEHLSKPLDPVRLVDAIRRLMRTQ